MRANGLKVFRTVAVFGSENAGKTTVFEEITGCFVCESRGAPLRGYYYYKYHEYEIFDLPSTYSLETACEEFDVIIYVINAVHLERELYNALLCSRKAKRFIPLVNFCDRAKKFKNPVNIGLLSGVFGVKAIKATANSGRGINALLEAVHKSFLK